MNQEMKLTKEELAKILAEMPDGEIHVIPFEDEKEGDPDAV